VAIPAAIVGLWHVSVTLTPRSTADAYSNGVPGTAVVVRGRVVYGNKRTWSVSGEEVVSGVQIYCEDVPTFDVTGTVTLPDGTTPKIHAVNRVSWPNDSSHLEIFA